MDIEGSKARVFVYELVDGELRVEKIEVDKPAEVAKALWVAIFANGWPITSYVEMEHL